MKAKVNLQLLKTTTFDSGALGMLAMILHQFKSAGKYRATILRQGLSITDVDFEVDDHSEVMQLNLDLAQAVRNAKARPEACDCKTENQDVRVISAKGYVLFHTSSGSEYAVRVSNAEGKVIFDSAKLEDDDLFAVSLLEPGVYSMRNTIYSAAGEIVVSLRSKAAKQILSLDTIYIDVNRGSFTPERVEATSSQGLVFRIKDSARILIEKKVAPQKERSKPVIHWRKPQTTIDK
jgi:hypothetical protein